MGFREGVAHVSFNVIAVQQVQPVPKPGSAAVAGSFRAGLQYLQFYWVEYFSHTLELSHKLDLIGWLPNREEALILCNDMVE